MKATGIVRRIDELGRVVIPKEIRRTQRIRFENFTVTDFDSLRTLPVGGLPPFLLSCSCTRRRNTP